MEVEVTASLSVDPVVVRVAVAVAATIVKLEKLVAVTKLVGVEVSVTVLAI